MTIRSRGRWRTTGLMVAGLVLGCANQQKPESDVPAPREDYEESLVGSTTPDPTAAPAETDEELAAKQAAAQKVMETVKDRDPEEEKKKLARSHAISAQAKQKLAKGQTKDAVSTARQALKVHEQNVDAMLVLAQVYFQEGKYELVRAVTSSALQIDPEVRTPEETSRAYNLQGFAMAAMGDDTLATQSFKKAAEVDENNAVAWNNLGTRYLDAGDAGTALSCFEYALQLDPRFVQAHLNHGAALRATGRPEEAEAAMRKALELRPSYAEAYFNLGVLYLDADPFPGLDTTQRLNKAIQNLSKYRELARGDAGMRLGQVAPRFAGAKAPPPRVSKDRADDFIRVAKKGLEREQRRIDREKERQAKAAAEPATPEEATPADAGSPTEGGESPAAGEGGPSVQGPGEQGAEGGEPAPSQPAPAKPEPSKPAPQGPTQPEPSKPAPAKPAPEPAKPTPTPTQPAPSKPAPSKPAPTQPTPTKPTPSKPAPQGPSTPAPTKPSPTPVKPAPQGPGSAPAPKPPPPQKPSVQKPQSARASASPRPKKISIESPSRGTRYVVPTLNSVEAGALALGMSSVDLAFVPTHTDLELSTDSRSHGLMVLAVDPLSTPHSLG